MNRLQKLVLVVIGLGIGVVQLSDINDHGIDDGFGWAISLGLSALLLFVGVGSPIAKPLPNVNVVTPPPPPPRVSVPVPSTRTFGVEFPEIDVRISELDLAIQAAEIYVVEKRIYDFEKAKLTNLSWSCCALIYAAMHYTVLKKRIRIHPSVWNSITRGISVRMMDTAEPEPGQSYTTVEDASYRTMKLIDAGIADALKDDTGYPWVPLLLILGPMLGTTTERERVEALGAGLFFFARRAETHILPELLDIFMNE